MSIGISTRRENTGEPPDLPDNLVGLLREKALRLGGRVAYTFLADGESEELSLTYGELDRRARAVAAWLQGRGLGGQRVLLLYPPGLDYLAAFWGCLYAGAVAVPAYPPRLNRNLARLQEIVSDAGVGVALTTEPVLTRLRSQAEATGALRGLRCEPTEAIDDAAAEDWREPALGPDALAFLQYTSGSTSAPKGVTVSHANLLHNEALIQRAFRQTERSVIVSWLPLYHDMGLIGGVLQPLYVGARCILMSPASFLQRPLRWLQAISRHRATTSGGPNFAYDLCARKVGPEERAALDLSSWGVAFNGSEPVRAETLERFAAAFGECGFRASAFQACYGLAEATLLVSGGSRRGGPVLKRVGAAALEEHRVVEVPGPDDDGAKARTLVGCGDVSPEQRVLIVDPQRLTPCPPDEVGEIWVGGPSVARGYWNKPEESAQTFGAYLAGTGEGPFLRTGDLGFFGEGELFVTGRFKDLIIVRGRNLYPQDIERTAELSHAALRPGGGAAFGVEREGEERLVLVHEVERLAAGDYGEVFARVRQAVAEEYEAQPDAVVLLKRGAVPKTSSGKVRRRACRELFLSGSLEPLAEWRAGVAGDDGGGATTAAPSAVVPPGVEGIAGWLRARLASQLGVDAAQVDPAQPISRYGLDSLSVVELMHAAEAALGVALPLESFLRSPSLDELAAEAARQSADATTSGSGVTTRAGAGAAPPLSHGQQALWFLHRMAPDAAAYNIAAAARLRGPLDAPALRRAFDALTARHPTLRTTFSAHDGPPVQRVRDGAGDYFEQPDASRWDEAALGEYLAAEGRRPFDLERGPLLRVRLLRRAEAEHVLLLVAHHIVVDFWSLAVLVRELGESYEAGRAGRPADLPRLEAEYGDYVLWQNAMLRGPEGERLRAYWERQLANPPTLDLPCDRPRPPAQTFNGAARAFSLDAGLTQRLKDVGQAAGGATLYVVLLAVFQTLLHRYTGRDDLAVGSPAVGRSRAAFAGVVGYFVNPLVLRADLSGDPAFVELIGRVRRTALDALAHQEYPFPLLVQRLQPGRDSGRSPLFEVMFVLQQGRAHGGEGLAPFALGVAGARMNFGGLELESLALEQRAAQFDLSLAMAEAGGGGLLASLEYNTDLFDEATIRGMCEHFRTLAEAVAADPRRRLSELPLLTEGERRLLLVGWNETEKDYGPSRTLHGLFEAQAARTPDAVAVVSEGAEVSYAELDERADRLARRLRSLGVGPEVLVAVLMERSAGMVVALLGVLKAGGAYVPLDPSYPSERLAYMLGDSGAAVLVTQESLLATLPTGTAAHVVCLSADGEAGADDAGVSAEGAGVNSEGAKSPAVDAAAGNLAYVIYTSGSTGRPKGAMNTHRGIVNRLLWMQDAYGLAPDDRVLQKTPFSFDVSMWEFFWPLMVGARLVMARPGGHQDPAYLGGVIDEQGITTLHFVPSMLQAFLAATGGRRHESLRRVICSGEALSFELQESFHARFGAELHNLYGPTEAAVDVSAWACERTPGRRIVPIGRPIANTRLYVLDKHLRPVPVGVAGELHIGGVAVGRGYLARPALTAEKFVPDPFSTEPGARLYKTGDLTRHLRDGNIEYLGRIDHQVKVRGFRIELGEIEAALREHEAVSECVVTARDEARGGARLVAYVVAGGGRAVAADGLRRFLKERLPEYMVPSAFVTLDELPLSPNGKLDRKALPGPDGLRPELEAGCVAPRDQLEESLADIWASVLGLERVGIHDNFFDLGGHSLLAAQVVSRVQAAFGVELPLRRVFESPTVAALAEVVAAAMKADDATAAPPVERAPRDGAPALSFAQQRLWFLDQLEPGDPAYNVPAAVRLTGRLDAAALARGVGEVVKRHESLRTTFRSVGGRPAQVVAEAGAWDLPVTDLRGLAAGEREAEARRLAEEEMLRPFDLERGPLLRVRLLRLDEEEHVLLLTMHHVIADGWSLAVFARELSECYGAFREGRPSPLPELPIQYADFAAWQRAWLSGPALETALGYWKRQLGGDLPVLELPSDRPRPPVRSSRGAGASIALPEGLCQSLRALGRRHNATLFMTLLAAFQVLLRRYTGQQDILVGTPAAGRTRVETEGLIGLFVNTLVLRADLSGDPSFGELLGRVRETTLAAHSHQEVPFELVVEELHPTRSLSHSPVFQVMFAWQNAPRAELSLPGVAARRVELESRAARFDLTLFLGEDGRAVTGYAEYDADRFDAATIDRLLANYRTLLEGVALDPGRRVSELPLLSEVERRLLAGWNDTRREYPRSQSLHQLCEAQAARTPDREALVCGRERLTYGELNARANRLARRLRSLGVGPERRVGVMLGRSAEMVVALLAVLKAGGAYVPLDPAYPQERLSFMLEDARAAVLLTEEGLKGRLAAQVPSVVCVDAERERLGREPGENLDCVSAPENLAYLIYTSGSTGRPKGVAIEHRSAVVLLHWAAEVFDGGQIAGVLASTSICFDLSVFELFVPLSRGGKIVLAENALELPELPAASEVTLVNTVPSAMTELLRMRGLPGGVETVNLAGEPLQHALAQRIYECAGVKRLLNLYGPSEDTTYSTWALLERGDSRAPGIGRPVANTQAYLLDAGRQPVPVGVVGELYLGGEGLARGYLDRPALTAERFVPNPFSDEPGARLYRTGDLARYRGDGQIEFLGRGDHQVKLRGFRIEPGEIEQALGRHPAVREALVTVREDEPDDKRLVAYVVATRGEAPAGAELRGFLKERLPDYMVPSVFVTLEGMPLTPNGKIDRKALPAPDRAGSEPARTYAPPRTPVEGELVETWGRLLGHQRLGIHDNFFDLGGHSLLATRVVSRVREVFRVELPLRSIFEAPTVAGLAARIEEAATGSDGSAKAPANGHGAFEEDGRGASPAAPILPAPRDGHLPLSFAQQRLWFLEQLSPGAYNLLGGLRMEGELDADALARAVNEVVRRHEALRTTFDIHEGAPAQVVEPARTVELPSSDLRDAGAGEREAKLRRIAAEESRRPFDLARGPLLRVRLVRLGEREHVALAVMHHIVSDGWSTAIFIDEVVALYGAFREGRPSPLPGLPIQYADYAVWQRQRLWGETLESLLAYWRRALAGPPPALELPADRPRPAHPTFHSAKLRRRLAEGLDGPLRALGRRHDATLYMTLLAAFQTLLYRYTGQEDVVVGAAIAGRNRAEVERLIGVFINMLVLRCDLSGNPRFSELLGRVREVALGAYAHQELPFDRLVDELQPQRALAQTPLFQVAFGLQNAPAPSLDASGLRLSHVEFDEEAGRYDLTLWVFEGAEGLTASWTYSTDLFDEATVARMHEHYEALLRGVAESPETRLRAFDISAAAERAEHADREREQEEALARRLTSSRRRPARRTPGAGQ